MRGRSDVDAGAPQRTARIAYSPGSPTVFNINLGLHFVMETEFGKCKIMS